MTTTEPPSQASLIIDNTARGCGKQGGTRGRKKKQKAHSSFLCLSLRPGCLIASALPAPPHLVLSIFISSHRLAVYPLHLLHHMLHAPSLVTSRQSQHTIISAPPHLLFDLSRYLSRFSLPSAQHPARCVYRPDSPDLPPPAACHPASS